jgi:hypothetical protein
MKKKKNKKKSKKKKKKKKKPVFRHTSLLGNRKRNEKQEQEEARNPCQGYLAALEALVKLGHAPRNDRLQRGREGVVGQLEADLVVALAGGAVRHKPRALLLGNLHLPPRNARARNG